MSLKKIKKIIEIKEAVAKTRVNKILKQINDKKKQVKSISDYKMAYLKTTRMLKTPTAYEMQNVSAFVGNLEQVVIKEKEANVMLENVYNYQKELWLKEHLKNEALGRVIEKDGIENAMKEEEEKLVKQLDLRFNKKRR